MAGAAPGRLADVLLSTAVPRQRAELSGLDPSTQRTVNAVIFSQDFREL